MTRLLPHPDRARRAQALHAHHAGASMSASISRAAATCQGAPPRMLGMGGETWRNASCLSAPLAAARGRPK